MRQEIFKYLKSYSTEPTKIDRLIISAFLKANNLEVKNNVLLKNYYINEKQKKEHKKVQDFVATILKENESFGFEGLIELFEFVISPEDRIVNGAIYTPEYIRTYIIDESIRKILEVENIQTENLKCADIACGCGGFLYNLSKKIKSETKFSYKDIFENNIFGLDIQDYSITRTKLLLSLLALSENEDEEDIQFNLYQGDTLSFDWKNTDNNIDGFNIIVGNPPYVRLRNLNDDTKELLKNWEVCRTGLTDLYIPFFQIGIENLSQNGVLGYITMNSFFKSLNGRALREYFEKNKVSLQILDFGGQQVFKSKSTYTCICFIQNKDSEEVEFTEIEKSTISEPHQFDRIGYKKLNHRTGWNLRNTDVISEIENTGIPFKELYNTRHGIATLKNNIYIFNPIKEDENYYYIQNGKVYRIEKEICKDIVNPNKIKTTKDLNSLREKILFPYTNEVKPKILDEEFIQEQYPLAFEYLQNKKAILAKRDKGKGEYIRWYAFGRTQSLEKVRNKLFFPKISNKSPNCVIQTDEDLYYYNGQAIISDSEEDLKLVKKIMESDLFWYYITKTSKPYNSNYYSLNGGYINNFGIPEFTKEEKDFLINQENTKILNEFIKDKYQVIIP